MKVLKALASLLLIVAVVASCVTCIKSFQIKPDEIISQAEKKATSMIDVANLEASAIMADAEEEASSIIDAAEKEKAKRIAEAKAKAEADAKKRKMASPFKISFPLELSDSDRDLLYRICNAEDGDSGKAGVQAVCWVILNRMASPRYPNTVYSVVYDKRYGVQFTPTVNGKINELPYQSTIDAVDEILAGEVPDPTGGALFFAMPKAAKGNFWENDVVYVCHIGSHNFYRDP